MKCHRFLGIHVGPCRGGGDPSGTCVVAVTDSTTRRLQGLKESLQRDMGQGLSHGVASSAVRCCHHGTHRCCRLWGPGHVCCRRNKGRCTSLICPPPSRTVPLTPASSTPPTFCQEFTAAGSHPAGQTASPSTGEPRVFLTVPVELRRHSTSCHRVWAGTLDCSQNIKSFPVPHPLGE